MASSSKQGIAGQITDRNFLTATGFHFQVNRAPSISYYGNRINVPGLQLGVVEQPNYLKNIPLPGEIIDFDDLTLRFLIDANLENYNEVQRWIRGIGFPESLEQIYKFQEENPAMVQPDRSQLNLYSDGTLTVLNQLNRPVMKIVFENLFPYYLTPIQFDATVADVEYLTAEVSFKYTIYNIRDIECC